MHTHMHTHTLATGDKIFFFGGGGKGGYIISNHHPFASSFVGIIQSSFVSVLSFYNV